MDDPKPQNDKCICTSLILGCTCGGGKHEILIDKERKRTQPKVIPKDPEPTESSDDNNTFYP